MIDDPMAEHTREASRLARVVDIVVTVILMLAGIVVVGMWVVFAPFSIMATDTCGPDDCDLDTFEVALYAAWFVPPAIYLTGVAWAVVRILQRRSSWWVPIVGAAAAFGVWYVAYEVMISSVNG